MIAHYETRAPLVPKPWTNWDFWQYTEHGKVPGIAAGAVDLDYFNGTEAELRATLL